MLRTRTALRDALLALLERKPFEQITIRDITSQAGIGYATFFRHYETKGVLLNDLAADQMRELIKLSLPFVHQGSNARPAALVLCRYVDEHHKLWSALLTSGAVAAMREEFIRQAAQAPSKLTKPGFWLPKDLRIVFGVSAMIEILTWWLQTGRNLSVEQVAEILDRLVITPARG